MTLDKQMLTLYCPDNSHVGKNHFQQVISELLKPLFQSEAKYRAFDMKIIFIPMQITRKKGFTLSLV